MPYVSKAKGKMSALLKQKSKIQAVRKERVTYDAFDFTEKRPRDEGAFSQSPESASQSKPIVEIYGNVTMAT